MALGDKRMQKNFARRDPFSWIHLQHVCHQLDKTISLAFTSIFIWHVFTQLMWDETEIVRKWKHHQIELDFLKCPTMLRKSRVLCGMKLTFSIWVSLCKMDGLVRYVRNARWRNEAMIVRNGHPKITLNVHGPHGSSSPSFLLKNCMVFSPEFSRYAGGFPKARTMCFIWGYNTDLIHTRWIKRD